MWRKMSVATWGGPTDPQIYGRMEVDMTQALAYAAQLSQQSGITITATHLLVRAVALCLNEYPEANAIIRWNRIYFRKRINIFCHVAIPGKKPDLSGVLVRDAETKDVVVIAQELKEKATAVRNGSDLELARAKAMLDKTPNFLYRVVLGVISFFHYTLNLNLSRFGIPQDAFGGAGVNSIGALGMSEAFSPLDRISRMPIVVSVGRIEEKPVVRNGNIVIRPMCVLCATLDHRIMDGYLAAKATKFVVRYLADPRRYEEQRQATASP